jgi:hypothetical protein
VADTGSLFSDATCTQPLATWNTCSPVPAVASSGLACGASYFKVGALYTGPTYERSGATCISATPSATTLYRLGAALPPSSFAAGTLTP